MKTRARVVLGVAGALGAVGSRVASRSLSRRIRASVDDDLDPLNVLSTDVRRHDIASHDGGNIHVIERGVGRPLVLVRGVTLQADMWSASTGSAVDSRRAIWRLCSTISTCGVPS